MNKKVFGFALMFFLSACGSTSKKIDATYINAATTYKIEDVDLHLNSKCEGKAYPNEAELKNIFSKKIRESFCQANTCNNGKTDENTINIKVAVVYKRVFMGEGFRCNEAYGHSSLIYSYYFSKNDQTIFSEGQSSELVTNKGLFGNLKTIATQISATGDADNEMENINIFTNAISKDISEKVKN